MYISVKRRSLLAGAGCAISASFAGCLSALDNTDRSQGTADLPIRFWLEEVSLAESEYDSVNSIGFVNLSTAERKIVRTALEDQAYTAEQGNESPALKKLQSRIEQRTGGGQTLEAYLRRNDTYYRIGYAAGDHIIAHPDH